MQPILSFCKTWWLNICLNLYLPLGHIFFSYKAHFMCAWGKLTLTISAHSHLSLFVGVLQSLMSHPLHALRHSPGSSSTSFKGLLSGCKSQCKWFPCNNFQFYCSFYGQRSTLNKPGKLGKIEVILYIYSEYLSALLRVVGHNYYVMLTILNILQLSKKSIFSLCNKTLLESN